MAAGLCLSTAATAESISSPVALASVGPNSIAWQPQVDHQALVLTVSGNDIFVNRRFELGEEPVFNGVDARGKALPDGTYTWQLTVIPRLDELDARESANGRSDNDGSVGKQAEARKALSQSGAFTISLGAFVRPDEIETDAGPYNE
jgi:hypothetical protein